MPPRVPDSPNTPRTKVFTSRKEAIKYLRSNPSFVRSRLGNLSKGSPGLLKDAGYKVVTSQTRGGKTTQLFKDGNMVDSWKGDLPAVTGAPGIRLSVPKPSAPKPSAGKDKSKPQRTAGGNQGAGTAAAASAAAAPGGAGVSAGIDYNALAAAGIIDPDLLKGMNPNVGNLIPLKLAQKGAPLLGEAGINEWINSLVTKPYAAQRGILERERERSVAQNEHNVAQLGHWYDQVIGSQGVAAQRDREFGQQAVASVQDSARAVSSALGGEANEGAGMVAAAGQENVGNIQAISTIQDQYNADLAPLLQGEKAGQQAREQAMGGQRLRDLADRLLAMEAERGSKEAETRFNLWQNNNEVLDRRAQTELAIRQANTGLRQQRFQNLMGVRQTQIAAATAGGATAVDAAKIAAADADSQRSSADKAADRAWRTQLEGAKEAGRNWRATRPSATHAKPFGQAGKAQDAAYNDILDALEDADYPPKKALQIATAVVTGYGWSPKNSAVAVFMSNALREAGY